MQFEENHEEDTYCIDLLLSVTENVRPGFYESICMQNYC